MCPRIGTLFKLGLVGLVVSWLALYVRYANEENRTAMVYSLPTRPTLDGPLAVNDKLQGAKYILKDQIQGPESIIVEGDSLFASLYDGRVVEIKNEKIVKEVRFTKHKNCGSFDTEPACGRPLGMRRLNEKEIVVADAYLGVFAVDMKKGSFRQLVKASVPVAGKQMRFVNDVEVVSPDEILFSDSSSTWDRRHFMNAVLEQNGDGRIYRHVISTGVTSLVLDGLFFPNGIQLLDDKKTLAFAECSMARIQKVDLSTGKVTSLAENLPGMPDNIRMDKDGALWVGMAGVRHSALPSFLDLMGDYPQIRQLIVDFVPGKFWAAFGYKVKPAHSMILKLDAHDGRVLYSMHDVTGESIQDVSQVTPSGDSLYLGSYHSSFIAVVKI